MKKSIILLALLLSGCDFDHVPNNNLCKYKSIDFIIGDSILKTQVACSNKQKSIGLMNVRNLEKDSGMIFVFDNLDYHQFWMKDTYIPLNIIFVDDYGVVTDIKEMLPHDLTPISPAKPSLYAVEANKNWFTQHKVKIGDKIKVKP